MVRNGLEQGPCSPRRTSPAAKPDRRALPFEPSLRTFDAMRLTSGDRLIPSAEIIDSRHLSAVSEASIRTHHQSRQGLLVLPQKLARTFSCRANVEYASE
jgi:hypothetical protein